MQHLLKLKGKKTEQRHCEDTSYSKGVAAEKMAADFLVLKGYSIIKQRYKTKFGEIDIIAKKKNLLCFVEVKVRKDYGDALEAVTPKSRKRIEQSALFFLSQENDYLLCDMSFDVIVFSEGGRISHLDNAWQARS